MMSAVRQSQRVTIQELLPSGVGLLHAERRECKEQAHNLGKPKSPNECAPLVLATEGCSAYFQWSKNTEWGCRCCKLGAVDGGPDHQAWNVYKTSQVEKTSKELDRSRIYVLPYVFEEWDLLVPLAGLRPPDTKNTIPADIRSEHYGLVSGRHSISRAKLLLVDRRSPRGFLPAGDQWRMSDRAVTVAAGRNQSCSQACAVRRMTCDPKQLHFVNNCHALQQHFKCTWCAHQVGNELPVYVPDDFQPTYRQCLVTFISPMNCASSHPATQRLCACMRM